MKMVQVSGPSTLISQVLVFFVRRGQTLIMTRILNYIFKASLGFLKRKYYNRPLLDFVCTYVCVLQNISLFYFPNVFIHNLV